MVILGSTMRGAMKVASAPSGRFTAGSRSPRFEHPIGAPRSTIIDSSRRTSNRGVSGVNGSGSSNSFGFSRSAANSRFMMARSSLRSVVTRTGSAFILASVSALPRVSPATRSLTG